MLINHFGYGVSMKSQEAFITNISFNFQIGIYILHLPPKIRKGKKEKKEISCISEPLNVQGIC